MLRASVHRYPFALASINVTMYCLGLAKSRSLQHFLLSSPAPRGSYKLPPSSRIGNPAHASFMLLHARLTLLWHHHWRRIDPPPNVMQFEEHFRFFKKRTTVALRRGLVGGIDIGWIEDIEI